MRYVVKAKGTILPFDGTLLAESSSKGSNPRWVEFRLYKAYTGQYVVERVGKSTQFHAYDCKTVEKNRLSSVTCEEIPAHYVPCPRCRPSRMDPEGLYPERERPDFQTCDKPKGVLRYLEQEDDDGLRYLTNVARELLAEASEKDSDIYNVYMIQSLD